MALKIYDESVINNFRTKYNYKLFSNNKLIVNRASVIVTKNLLDNLKIIESYEKNNNTNFNSNSNYKRYNKNFNKNNPRVNKRNVETEIEYIRNIPRERPKTFLNISKGKKDDIKKELNGNMNKLSNKNSEKIFLSIIKLYSENFEIFDYDYFVDNLFDKAVLQPIYCPIYVKLIILVKDKFDQLNNGSENVILKLVKNKCEKFKNMINEFVNVNDDVLDVNNYDDFCDKNKQKLYKKGFSQFIGELYKNDFVDCQYIIEYIDGLINNIKYNLDNSNTNIENSSICLCQLISTSLSKKEFLNSDSFDSIKEIIQHKFLSKKLKFKFLDLIEK